MKDVPVMKLFWAVLCVPSQSSQVPFSADDLHPSVTNKHQYGLGAQHPKLVLLVLFHPENHLLVYVKVPPELKVGPIQTTDNAGGAEVKGFGVSEKRYKNWVDWTSCI